MSAVVLSSRRPDVPSAHQPKKPFLGAVTRREGAFRVRPGSSQTASIGAWRRRCGGKDLLLNVGHLVPVTSARWFNLR